MRVILHHQDSYLLEAIQSPIEGWLVRPGTFRVAQPYDKPSPSLHPATSNDIQSLSTGMTHISPPIAPRARKKQKISKEAGRETSGSEGALLQWIQSAYQDLLSQDKTQSLVKSMQCSYFYGTYVDAPANDTFALDLVKLQPTLRLLSSGFVSTSDTSFDKKDSIVFDEVQLNPGLQQLDLSDIYETLVVNNHPDPALVAFPTDGKPHYLIPPRSQKNGGFNIIIMDPPWQNASVDRMAHYGTMDLYDLFKIPIPDLLGVSKERSLINECEPNGIVAVWITNRAKVKKVVVEKLFPAWGLEFIAHWNWLKVTTSGEPVLSLENTHRRAYEGILIGRQISRSTKINAIASPVTSSNPSKKLLVSVPSQHSRKPSITAVLEEEFFPKSCIRHYDTVSTSDSTLVSGRETTIIKPLNKLELFARNLEEGVISWGNEPIRYQYCGRGSEDTGFTQDGYLVPSHCSMMQADNKD
ncbi:Methyltransferase-like protein 4 [Mortierella sp. AM989]|nr:Methyltransferase-like protein 4 [Mortierella sp. AM989]